MSIGNIYKNLARNLWNLPIDSRTARVGRKRAVEKRRGGSVFPIHPIHHLAKCGRPTPAGDVVPCAVKLHSLSVGFYHLTCELAYIVSYIVVHHFDYFLSLLCLYYSTSVCICQVFFLIFFRESAKIFSFQISKKEYSDLPSWFLRACAHYRPVATALKR